MLTGCGADFATIEPDNPSQVSDGLVFTRADGSSYEVKAAAAQCIHGGVMGTEYVRVDADVFVLEVAAGISGEHQLPLTKRWGPPDTDLVLRANDPQTGDHLTGAARRARGAVVVNEATCDPEPRLSVQIDARLAGPQGGPVTVQGGLATVAGAH